MGKAARDPKPQTIVDKAVLDELDAESRAVLDHHHQKLPMWIGLYSHPDQPGPWIILRHGERVPRGTVPAVKGRKLQFAAIIDDASRLDPTARYVMRLWMAEQRRRLAVLGKDRDAQQAAGELLRWLHAHPPKPKLTRRGKQMSRLLPLLRGWYPPDGIPSDDVKTVTIMQRVLKEFEVSRDVVERAIGRRKD